MKNTTKFILVGIAIVIVAIVGGYVFARSHHAPSVLSSTNTTASSTPTSTTLNFVIFGPGSKGILVTDLQKLLIKDGYLKTATTTGVFDATTEVAVKEYQKADNVPQTGVLTIPSSSLSLFFASVVPPFMSLQLGDTGTRVVSLQAFLIKGGYLKATSTTGYFGSATQIALEAFQKDHGLVASGIMDVKTFAAMNGK